MHGCHEPVADRRAARRRAQEWFADAALRPVSTAFDDRETSGSRRLALAVALALLGRDPSVVVDLGCGSGQQLVEAAARLPTARLVGLDPVPEAVAEARAAVAALPGARRVEVVQVGAEQLPLLDVPPADLLLAHLDLALWDDPLAGLAGALRAAGPGGLLCVVDLVRPGPGEDVEPFLAAAADGSERAYLADQLAASFDFDEARALVDEAVRAAGVPCRAVVRRGGLGGAPLGSPEAARLWSQPAVGAAVAALGPLTAVEAAKAEQVLHVQVWREP